MRLAEASAIFRLHRELVKLMQRELVLVESQIVSREPPDSRPRQYSRDLQALRTGLNCCGIALAELKNSLPSASFKD